MVNGYNNRGLDVHLDSGRISAFELGDEVIARYLGGRGLGVFFLRRDLAATVEPLAAENLLVVAAGGLNGSMAPTGGRFSVTFKSPLTGTIASANSGGFWGVTFKRSGHDLLVLRGCAAAPVYLHISEQGAELRECPELWGESIPAVTAKLKERHSKAARVLAIGPAGENGVRFAALINDNSRAVGRAGVGAVMGSKKLKAIVVEGQKQYAPSRPDLYQSGIYQANKLLKSMPVTSRALTELGTAGLVKLIYDHDMLPHRNFQDVTHRPEDVEKISGEALRENILVAPRACFNCRIACGRQTRVGERHGEGPEYETVALLGANLGIYDIREVALANYLCNELGMDTISFGNTVGLAMELFERGVIGRRQTKGLELRFGSSGILEKLASQTAFQRDFGRDIALGAKRLAEKYGMPQLAMVVKGLELPGYEPRATMAQALGYATSPRGGCHLQGGYAVTLGFFGASREVDRFLIETTAGHVVNQQDSGCISDMLGLCRFSSYAFGENEISRIYSGFSGIDLSPHDLEKIARHIQEEERRFNIGAGFDHHDDTLPERMFSEKIMIAGEPRAIDRQFHFQPLLQKYYEIRGWDEKGLPTGPGKNERG